MDKYIGKILNNRYEIEELIGIGGMANVYKAKDTLTNRETVVKFLRDEHLSDPDLMRRFKNESKAIALLSHPNIVKIYDFSFDGDVQFIVMEYIDGITLKEYIERQSALHWKDVVHFSVQILQALQHAHDKGIVHRDIKPQNIMLLEDGTIKVTDFGIARFARTEERTATDNKALGSVHYISPEQARGECADEKSDIYSVGVEMYEMLTGQLPFDAENAVSVALKQIEAEPKRLRQINSDIPQGLEDIVLRAMQKDASNRYQSAAEFLRDLYKFKNDPSIIFENVDKKPTEIEYYESEQNEINKRKQNKKKKKKIVVESAYKEKVLRHSPILAVLLGVSLAFILTMVVFILGMFKIVDPLKKTDDLEAPDFIGMMYTELSEYKDFKFEIVTPEYTKDYERGQIIKQYPNAGKLVKKGSTIQITVSLGPALITIPDFENYDLSIATAQLQKLNIKYTVVEGYDENIPSGKVIKTEPAAKEEIVEGTPIVVYLSRGNQTKIFNMPDLTGYTLAGARTYLQSLNLKIGNITEEASNEIKGTVISQSPEVGSPVKSGTYVNLVIAKEYEKTSTITTRVVMPKKTEIVLVDVKIGDSVLWSGYVDLSETRVWTPTFKGEGKVAVAIYLNDQIYREYSINFDTGEYSMRKEYEVVIGQSSESSTEESQISEISEDPSQSSEESSESSESSEIIEISESSEISEASEVSEPGDEQSSESSAENSEQSESEESEISKDQNESEVSE